ncbi:MAG TPA: hypothetical protein VLV86_26280 [Vicinamibacterales bacterium]|nr:hypothetical protein [Vicinamibacterales bacterium]
MRNGIRTAMMAAGLAAVVSLAIGTAVLRGQAPAGRGAAPAARVPRTADGKPNLNGIWQVLVSANWNLEDHGASAGPFFQEGAVGAIPAGQSIVEGGDIPYTPAALAKRNENARNRLTLDPEVKCYMPGIPRANYMPYPFQIVQSPQNILFAYEYASSNRVVNMGKPTEAPVDSWMGWSNGKWEGDTLVVDVTGLNGNAWLDRAGNYTTDNTHVVERFTLMDADHINYEATVTDSKLFTRPWKLNVVLYKHLEKNFQLLEFKCVEFAEEMLYGHLRKRYN